MNEAPPVTRTLREDQFMGTETTREEKKGTTAEDVIAEVRETFAEKSDAAKK